MFSPDCNISISIVISLLQLKLTDQSQDERPEGKLCWSQRNRNITFGHAIPVGPFPRKKMSNINAATARILNPWDADTKYSVFLIGHRMLGLSILMQIFNTQKKNKI